jgi:hypothetical protein
MAKRAVSARGETVDFDLLTIKAQEAANKANVKDVTPVIEIKQQENFMDRRVRRRIKKATTPIVDVVADPVVVDVPNNN